jgi:hypothetical protein
MPLSEMAWVDGPPPMDTRKTLVCWLKMYDQGGYPFVQVALVHPEFAEGFDHKENSRLLFEEGIREPIPLVPWVNIPGLKVDSPLKDVWNITAHQILTKPSTE